jgi:membrane associated rhomboid family serine protease
MARVRAWDVVSRFPGTLGVLTITLLIFALEHGFGGATDLRAQIRLGAMRVDRVAEHAEVWRLVTSMFLHHGIIHLLINTFALVQLGPLVESLWGTRRFLTFFVACGIAGSLASAAFTPSGYAGSVGASGALMGLAGLLLGTRAFGEENVREFLGDLLGRRLLQGVLLTLGLGFGLWLVLPVVDNWSHVGGLVCGFALALAHPDPVERNDLQTSMGFSVTLLVLSLSWGACAVQGARAWDTLEVDTARMLSVRASANPGGLASLPVLPEMLDWYDQADLPEEGLDRYTRAVRAYDDPLYLRQLVGMLALQQEETGAERDQHMMVTLERWLEVAPDDPDALNATAWHLVTRQHEEWRDPARAEPLSRESLRRIPEPDSHEGKRARSAYLDTLGEILFQQGRYAEARETQLEAVALAKETELPDLGELEARLYKIEAKVP